jgi:2-dehydro-3-deoxyphosphogluconate aldolase/(4S)-4-hydroxy-2-oxoglutarate aldolase
MTQNAPAFSWKSFTRFPAIGILRGFPTELVESIATCCFEAGLLNLEVTLNTPDALKQIEILKRLAPKDVNIGAGTVLSPRALLDARNAGASFIVSPIVDESVIALSSRCSLPCFPGAFSPTEVWKAWKAGAPCVKWFPANLAGPSGLASVRAPLDQVPLIAVGSVNLANLEAYLKAGACGIGLGSPLFDEARMRAKDWNWLRTQIHAFQAFFDQAPPRPPIPAAIGKN